VCSDCEFARPSSLPGVQCADTRQSVTGLPCWYR
jgi:hypothetical protein